MNRMLAYVRAFLVGLTLTGALNPSFAASGIVQITVKDAGGTSRNINVTSDSGALTGNLMWNNVICDPTTTTQCAAVSAGGAVSVNITAGLNTNGQKTSAASAPVVIASDQSTLAIKGADAAGSPTAGTVLAIQGIASMTKLLVTPDSVALPANQSVNVNQVGGAALPKGGIGVVNGGSTYQHIAASQTAAVLQTSTGAAGDYLSHCVIYPSTTAAGSVTVFDNANAAATNVIEFTTGTLSNLAPIVLPVGAVSTAGAWKVTTGANETVVCYGKFS